MSNCLQLALLFVSFFIQPLHADYNVISFGAKPDGNTDATQAFLKAWALACDSVTATTIYIPKGRFLLRETVFRGPCKNKITFQIDGTLVAPLDFRALGNSGYWILFIKVNGIAVYGGRLDARGAGFWDCRRSGKSCPVGATVCLCSTFLLNILQLISSHTLICPPLFPFI